jgi:tRNA pseudouridine55 synthase
VAIDVGARVVLRREIRTAGERKVMSPSGLLNLNKPQGATSRQVVNQVQRLVRPAKVGHAGTLDPLATGVLVVAVGSATRLIELVQQQVKRYRGTFLLGCTSDTEDVEGDVTQLDDPPRPTRAAVEFAAEQFVGTIQQRPPIYSALKVDGRRSYKLARRGEAVELDPRPVEIHALSVVGYAYPHLTLEIRCGSGTYVRSLGRDLAESLGTAAVMESLVRTAVGRFHLDAAIDPRMMNAEMLAAEMHPAVEAVADLPQLQVDAQQARRLRQGQSVDLADAGRGPLAKDAMSPVAALDSAGNLVALLEADPQRGWRPAKTFPEP